MCRRSARRPTCGGEQVRDCTDRELRTGSVWPESPAASPSAPSRRNPPSSDEEPEGSFAQTSTCQSNSQQLTGRSASSATSGIITTRGAHEPPYCSVLLRVESETGMLTWPTMKNRCDPVSGARQTYPYKLEGRSAINHRLIGRWVRHATRARCVSKHTPNYLTLPSSTRFSLSVFLRVFIALCLVLSDRRAACANNGVALVTVHFEQNISQAMIATKVQLQNGHLPADDVWEHFYIFPALVRQPRHRFNHEFRSFIDSLFSLRYHRRSSFCSYLWIGNFG